MSIKEFIGVDDKEINEIAYWLVKIGAKETNLKKLAKKVEKHTKTNEGRKFLYFLLGEIASFERLMHIITTTDHDDMDAESLIQSEFSALIEYLKGRMIEHIDRISEKA